MRPLPSNPRFVIPIVAGVGNALMAVPMARQIKSAFPGAHVTIIARINAMAEPFRRLTEIDQVLVTGKGVKGLLRSILGARREHADVYLVPFPSNRWQYSLLAMFSGAKIKLLHGYPIGKFRALGFIGDRVPAIRGLHDVVQNLRLLEALQSSGIVIANDCHPERYSAKDLARVEMPDPSRSTAQDDSSSNGELDEASQKPDQPQAPKFILNDGDRACATRMLESVGLAARTPFIAIHAGSATTILAQAKRWPPGKYAELIHALRRETAKEVILLEGPDESGVADEIMSKLQQPAEGVTTLKLTGPLGDAAAVLERAALYVGSDSGLAHLAAAVGTRAVTIFAPADPDRVCPFGNRDLVVQPGKSCSPCFLYPWQATYPKMKCTPPFCVREIEVEQIMQAVRRAIGGIDSRNHVPISDLSSGDSQPGANPCAQG